jgi:hypothetical protein
LVAGSLSPSLTAALQLFGAGALIAMVTETIIPEAVHGTPNCWNHYSRWVCCPIIVRCLSGVTIYTPQWQSTPTGLMPQCRPQLRAVRCNGDFFRSNVCIRDLRGTRREPSFAQVGFSSIVKIKRIEGTDL